MQSALRKEDKLTIAQLRINVRKLINILKLLVRSRLSGGKPVTKCLNGRNHICYSNSPTIVINRLYFLINTSFINCSILRSQLFSRLVSKRKFSRDSERLKTKTEGRHLESQFESNGVT